MKNKDIFTFRDAEKQAGPVAFSTMLKPAGSACNSTATIATTWTRPCSTAAGRP